MSTEHLFLAACGVIFVLSLLYAARNRSPVLRARVQSAVATLKTFEPVAVQVAQVVEPTAAQLFAQAMTAIESDGVKQAVKTMVDQFAQSHAADYKARVQGIVSPKDQATPPAAS